METFIDSIKPFLKHLTPAKIVFIVSGALAILSLTIVALPLFLIFAIVAILAYLAVRDQIR
ncbi:hypothetical protein BH09PAT2_BH09PAT2_11090 [soil metagenome]